jgi:hypothetical protein
MPRRSRTPTRADHDRFGQLEGWRPLRDARGRTGTRRFTSELVLPDGRTLPTGVSPPPDRTGYGPSLFAHILRDQLAVTEKEFWVCVRDGTVPDRGLPETPSSSLPADLVHRVGIPETDVRRMSRAQAVERAQRYRTEGT